MVPDFEPSWSGQAVMSELDGWDSNVPNIDRSHHRHRSRTLVTEKPWTEWRTVLTVRRLITVKSAQKLGRHEVDSIHSQPPLHCPSDEAGDGLAVGGLYLAVGGHVPASAFANPNLFQPHHLSKYLPLDFAPTSRRQLSISDISPSAHTQVRPWRRTLARLETQQPPNGKLKTDRERL